MKLITITGFLNLHKPFKDNKVTLTLSSHNLLTDWARQLFKP